MDEKIERKIAVIFVSDVVGFSTLMKTNEIATLKSLRACVKILENLLEEHGGRIFNTAGDSVLAEFQSAVSAVICATEFQKLIKQRNHNVPDESKMQFRIGLNMGDVIVEGSNLYGDGWNSPLKVAHPLGYVYPYYRRTKNGWQTRETGRHCTEASPS